jgi:hypothetical protein
MAQRVHYSGFMQSELMEQAKARAAQELVSLSRLIEWAVIDFLKHTRARERAKTPRATPRKAPPPAPPVVPPLVYREDLKKGLTAPKAAP